MKKINILFIIFVLMLSFVGCNSNNLNSTEKNTETDKTQEFADSNSNNLSSTAKAAAEADKTQGNQDKVCAVIMEMDRNKIVLDIAEYITLEDTERMSELNLKEFDMPNGYYIYNPDKSTQEYILTKDTIYNFIDWGRDFVNEDAEDLYISTTSKEVFLKYIQSYINAGSKEPFFFEFDGNNVISITEEVITSQ